MVNPNRFYTYAYLREDRTPYYIGKGTGKRLYKKEKGQIRPPKNKLRIILLKQNLTEEEAFKHEIYMIAVFGRKDLGTGILHNRTDGGEGASGAVRSEEYKTKKSQSNKGENNPNYGKRGEKHQIYGKKWWNDGHGNDRLAKECPGDGWYFGRSKEYKVKMSEIKKGKNNPMSNYYEIEFLNGKKENVYCLTEWARENGYKKSNLFNLVCNLQKSPHKDILKIIKI